MEIVLYLMIFTFLGVEAYDTVPICSDPNSVYSGTLATACQNTCEQPDLESRCRPLRPEAGCICIPGFVKNSDGICVTLEQCTKSDLVIIKGEIIVEPEPVIVPAPVVGLPCGDNEHYEKCARTCPSEHCSAIGVIEFCPRQPPLDCRPACRCNDGYRRDSYGICIPANDCPRCGANEIYSCGSACQTTCDTLGQTCPIVNIRCNDDCFCIEGYARDAQGICIPIKSCPQHIRG